MLGKKAERVDVDQVKEVNIGKLWLEIGKVTSCVIFVRHDTIQDVEVPLAYFKVLESET